MVLFNTARDFVVDFIGVSVERGSVFIEPFLFEENPQALMVKLDKAIGVRSFGVAISDPPTNRVSAEFQSGIFSGLIADVLPDNIRVRVPPFLFGRLDLPDILLSVGSVIGIGAVLTPVPSLMVVCNSLNRITLGAFFHIDNLSKKEP